MQGTFLDSKKIKTRKLSGKRAFFGLVVICVFSAGIYVTSQINRLSELTDTRFSIFGTSFSLYDAIKQHADFFIEQWQSIPAEETDRQAALVKHWLTSNNMLFIGLYKADGTLIYKSPNNDSIKHIQAQHTQVMTVSLPFIAHSKPMQIVMMVDTHSDTQIQEKQKNLVLGLLFVTASVSLLAGVYFSKLITYLRDKTRK